MNKLLIFIGEDVKFDVDATIKAILTIPGVSDGHREDPFGALFECTYAYDGDDTTVRIASNAETVVVLGERDVSLAFALELQRVLPFDLRVTDMNLDFDVVLRGFDSIAELSQTMVELSDEPELRTFRKGDPQG